MKLEVLNTSGKPAGRQVELPDDVFAIEPNEHAVYLAVKQYLGNQRQGTHKAKERGEISFSTRKIKRQKGTGTARAGSLRSPIFRKGGRIFGPKPHEYRMKLNKKVRTLARNSALSIKANAEAIKVVEDIKLSAPKTKDLANTLTQLELADVKTIIVLADTDKNLYLSARNLPKVKVMPASNLNTYEVMNAGCILFSESAVADFTNNDNN